MQLAGIGFRAIKPSLYNYRIHKDTGITNSLNSNEQRFFIDVVRKRYVDKKRNMSLSWRGEPPNTMKPRRRVKAEFGLEILSDHEALDHAYALSGCTRADRELGFVKIYNRLERPSIEVVSQICETIWNIGNLEASIIDILRVIYVKFRNRMSSERAKLARQQYLAIAANGSERGFVAIGADYLELGNPELALRHCRQRNDIQSEPWGNLLLYTGLKAYLELQFIPADLFGYGETIAKSLFERMDQMPTKELIHRNLDVLYLNVSLCLSYLRLRSDADWSTGHQKHPLSDVTPDILDFDVNSMATACRTLRTG